IARERVDAHLRAERRRLGRGAAGSRRGQPCRAEKKKESQTGSSHGVLLLQKLFQLPANRRTKIALGSRSSTWAPQVTSHASPAHPTLPRKGCTYLPLAPLLRPSGGPRGLPAGENRRARSTALAVEPGTRTAPLQTA